MAQDAPVAQTGQDQPQRVERVGEGCELPELARTCTEEAKDKEKETMMNLKVAFWGANTAKIWGELTPEVLQADRMIGGAEASLIYVSRGLAKLGHRVVVFSPACSDEQEYDGVIWRPSNMYNPRSCYDALILWDNSDVCQYDPCAHAVVLGARCNTQPHLRDHYRIDWLVALSEWQRGVLCRQHRILSTEYSEVVHNGVDLVQYAEKVEPIPNRIIYCSSPDRGLHHLLRIWPALKERVPDAELHIFYSFGGFERVKWQMTAYAQMWWYVKTHLDQPGVFNHGPVGKQTLAREQQRASLMTYPSDLFVDGETFCTVILECMAAGTPCLISDAAALPGVYGDAAAILPRPIDDGQWIEAIVKLLADEEIRQKYIKRGLKFASLHSWERTVAAWDRIIRERVKEARFGLAGGYVASENKPMGNRPSIGYPAIKQGRP